MDARTENGRRTAHRGAGVVQPVKKGGTGLSEFCKPGTTYQKSEKSLIRNLTNDRAHITQDAQEV